jgi:tRNA pseudouridine38-40 synthase
LPYRDKNIFLPDRFMKFFIRLSYNGAPFSGWQIQKNANSVQEELQKAFSTLLKEKIEITGAGRTDSGVNAVNYIAHTEISSSKTFSGKNPADFLYKINAILPKEIVVKNIFKMPASAHARFDAVSRTYKYYLTLEKEPFNSAFTYFYRPGSLDIEAMNKAAKYFLGEQDFTSLEKLHSGAQNSICNVTAAGWERITASTQHTAAGWEHTPANTQHTATSGSTAADNSGAAASGNTAAGNSGAAASGNTAARNSGAAASGNTAAGNNGATASGSTAAGNSGAVASGSTAARNSGAAASGSTAAGNSGAAFITPCTTDIYVYTVTANRFLRNMVRAMVGSLLEVGSGKRKPEWIAEMLARKDRCAAGYSVPGNALFLTEIRYPYPIK